MSEEKKMAEELAEESLGSVNGGTGLPIRDLERVIADLPADAPEGFSKEDFRKLAKETGKSGIRRMGG